jgi:CIC family chloride channel protein
LGVGYDNITNLLSGNLPLSIILGLCFFKFLSWSIALGSGTSGGTLAPLLTIGGASGAILGTIVLFLFPDCGVNVAMSALIGMSAMFAGASRAYLTSITFALESTMQSSALLPLLGACTSSYLISLFFMKNTIMTEKIARRGVITPDSYQPDMLSKINVDQIVNNDLLILNTDDSVQHVLNLIKDKDERQRFFLVKDKDGNYEGVIDIQNLLSKGVGLEQPIKVHVKKKFTYVNNVDTLKRALEILFLNKQEYAPVLAVERNEMIGVISQKSILNAYHHYLLKDKEVTANLSLKTQRKKVLVRGRQLMAKKK